MSSPAHSPKNKAVAFMLAWFLLGQFGAHYFYLGNKRTGKIRLILGLLVVPLPFLAVLAILEGLQYLRDSKERFAERVARGGGMANCWQKTAAVTIAGIALTVTALAFVPEPPPPDPAEAAAKDAEELVKKEQENKEKKPKYIEKLEKDVAKALRPHKEIQVKSRESVTEGQWTIVANFVTFSVDVDAINPDMMEAYKKVYTSDAPVDRVALVANGELVDGYGNEIVVIVYTTEMEHAVGKRINWENASLLNPSHVMTTTYKHPLLR